MSGRRLARWALSVVYGRGGEWSGPLFKAMTVEGNSAHITFDHVGRGLAVHGDGLGGFEVAGADRHFVRADARIERRNGHRVVAGGGGSRGRALCLGRRSGRVAVQRGRLAGLSIPDG